MLLEGQGPLGSKQGVTLLDAAQSASMQHELFVRI